MPVREITKKEELLECQRIQSIAFVSPWDREEAGKNLEFPSKDPMLGHFDGEGRLTACLALPAYTACYQGRDVALVGVGGVASLPEHRRGGAVRSLFQTSLEQMWQKGAAFAALYPFSHSYYRKFGFELCQSALCVKVPVQALEGFSCTCQVRQVLPGDPTAPLEEVYGARLGRYNLAIRREARHWQGLLGKAPLKERRYTYLLEDGEGPLAYVVFTAREEAPYSKAGYVRELAYKTPGGLAQALGFLHRLAAQYECFYLENLPGDVPLAALVPGCYDLKAYWKELPMARIVRVEEALLAKDPGEGRSYTLAVEDRELPQNNGLFQVANRAGNVAVEKLPAGQADLSLDIGTLTQLCLGYLSLEQTLYKPQTRLSAGEEALRAAFPQGQVFLTEYF